MLKRRFESERYRRRYDRQSDLVPAELFAMMPRRFGKNRPHVPRRYPPDRGHRRTELPAGTLVGRKKSIFLVLHHRHHQYRRGDGATADAALDHYRRHPPQAGGPWRRRSRRAAGARARRALRIHQRRPASYRLRLHDRPLPDGERERRPVRDRRSDILARQPRQQAGVELGVERFAVSRIAVILRESGVSSTPRPFDFIIGASEYWITRFRE